jgi:hypothetical protein
MKHVYGTENNVNWNKLDNDTYFTLFVHHTFVHTFHCASFSYCTDEIRLLHDDYISPEYEFYYFVISMFFNENLRNDLLLITSIIITLLLFYDFFNYLALT